MCDAFSCSALYGERWRPNTAGEGRREGGAGVKDGPGGRWEEEEEGSGRGEGREGGRRRGSDRGSEREECRRGASMRFSLSLLPSAAEVQ